MKKTILTFCSLLTLCGNMIAEEVFKVAYDPVLKIDFAEKLFITRDAFSNRGMDEGKLKTLQDTPHLKAFCSFFDDQEFKFYKEISSSGNEIELNVWTSAQPLNPGAGGYTTYTMDIPGEFLEGAKYRILCHNPMKSAPKKHSGTFSSKEPNNEPIATEIIYIELEKEGKHFAIDLQPCGSTETKGYGNGSRNLWRLYRNGENYQLKNLVQYWYLGGANHFKVLFRSKDDALKYETIHPFYVPSEYFPYKIVCALNIGTNTVSDDKIFLKPCATSIYDPNTGWGWLDNSDIKVFIEDNKHIPRGSIISSNKKAVFRIKCPAGIYLLNIQSNSNRSAVKPFDISINNKKYTFPMAEKGDFKLKTISINSDKDYFDVELSGNPWQISALSVQAVLTRQEDFILSRKWWKFSEAVPDCARFNFNDK